MISYEVSFDNPNNHLFKVKLVIESPDSDGQKLSLPNWIPGSYMIRDFAKNIVSMTASCDDKQRSIEKLDKSSWQVVGCESPLVIEYEIYALDLSVRSAHLDNSHAFFNGTSLFLQPSGLDDSLIDIRIMQPLAGINDWTVKTSLHPQQVDEAGFGIYRARDYEELIDCPVEVSSSTDIQFMVNGVPHYLHLTGDLPQDVDEKTLGRDLATVCCEHAALFKDELPMREYRFLTMVVENGYGGLEHKSSTALVCSPADLPRKQHAEQTDEYRKFLGLCSHEYFHLWNVKRIKPLAFQQHDLSEEVHTTLLWAFEGITSYYDDLALLRSGRITMENYLQLLAGNFTRLYRSPGRLRQTLFDSSFDAWTKFYKQDENAPNAIVSYYTKGAVVALGLDVMLRQKSQNQVTLDDFMRRLWLDFGKKEIGVAEGDLEKQAEELVGESLDEFFQLSLRSNQELPVEDWLKALGIGFRLRQEENPADQGKCVKHEDLSESSNGAPALTFGCRLKNASTEVAYVQNNSAAEQCGICPGDTLVALGGKKITPDNYEKLLAGLSPGQEVAIHIFRRDCLYAFSIQPEEKPTNVCDLYLIPDAELSDRQRKMHSSWQSGNAIN